MTRLNQIIAIEKGVKTGAEKAFTAAYRELQKTEALTGISRTYVPMLEDGVQLPPETKLPQVRAGDAIDSARNHLIRLFDVVGTKDEANQDAAADVVIDGNVILSQVAVTTLLFLEKQLVELKEFTSKLPVLDPAERWTWNAEVGIYISAPSSTIRAKKVLKNHVLAEATKDHPAQVQTYTEDVPEGTWTTVKYSGALPSETVLALVLRIAKLTEAVKQAREDANSIEVTDVSIGASFFNYLLGPVQG